MHIYGTMKAGGLVAAALLLLAAAARAEPVEAPLETAAGLVDIAEAADGFSRYLTVGAREFLREDGYAFVSLYDRQGDLVLVQVSTGGNACPAEYLWLNTTGGDIAVSEVFGTCSEEAEVRSGPGGVVVTMPSFDAAVGFVDFTYDGARVVETAAGQQPSASPPSSGADGWIGGYPYDLFTGSDWRGPLVALMGEEAYRSAGAIISLSTPMQVQGDWVTGSGCDKYDCDTVRGAVAIHRGDGRLLVALRTPDNGARLWGDSGSGWPEAIAQVMQ